MYVNVHGLSFTRIIRRRDGDRDGSGSGDNDDDDDDDDDGDDDDDDGIDGNHLTATLTAMTMMTVGR